MISIVCVDIQDEGNLGAIARLMLNFGLTELRLVNTGHAPGKKTIHPLSKSAFDRASHAKHILKNIKIYGSLNDALSSFDYAVGTTALVGDDYNLKRTPLTPQEIAAHIAAATSAKKRIAIVLGREDHGLSNEELGLCDITVTIPASKEYPVLNVSHACAILLCALFSALHEQGLAENQIKSKAMAGKTELTHIQQLVDEILKKTQFPTQQKKETQKLLWHRIFAKSFLTRREAFGVMGFLKRVLGRR